MNKADKQVKPQNRGNLALKHYELDDEAELPTSPLHSGRLTVVRGTPTTNALSDDDLPSEQGAGMGLHVAAPRIVPTVGARVRTGVRRSFLLALLLALAGGALAYAGYLLVTTPWLAGVAEPTPATTTAEQPAQSGKLPKDDQQVYTKPIAPGPANGASFDAGVEQYRLGNYDKAIDLLERYILVSGGDAPSYYQLGLAYMGAQGREHASEDAELAFRTASSLQPTWAPPYSGLAESLMRRGLYSQAVAPAKQAAVQQPATPEVWLTLGRAYRGAGMQAEADRAFAQAAYLSPAPPKP